MVTTMRHLDLELEALEERIAPGAVGDVCGSKSGHSKSNGNEKSRGSNKSKGSKSHGSKSGGSKSC